MKEVVQSSAAAASACAVSPASRMADRSVRATVRWGRNGRSSGGQPAAASATSSAARISASSGAPSSMPSHSARIFRASGGNDPAPRSRTANGAKGAAAAPTAAATSDTRLGSVSPRNRSVKCSVSTCTQRAARPKGVALTGSMSSRQASLVACGTGTATNRRCAPSATLLEHVALAVAGQDLERAVPVPPAEDVDVLLLQQLVGREEVLDLHESMRTDLLEALDVLLVRVADRHAQRLEVEAFLVPHLEASDRPGPDVTARERGLVDDEEGVGVVPIVGPGALDEAVVEVVEHGG